VACSHRERIVPLTVDQVRALADAMPPRNRAMVIAQAGLGLRLGELLALRVQDVDFAPGPYRHEYHGSRIFGAAVRQAGLPDSITTHDLRHHYASVLLMQGEPVIVVADRLGHENATLVLSTYGHLMPDSEERTRRAVDDAWGCAPDVPQTGETTA
jgi:integrase